MPSPEEFDALYESDRDPWEVATSWYERRKIALALAVLRRERYGVAWDAACGTGDLTAALAQRATRVVATDSSPAACELTRQSTATIDHVTIECSALPARPAALAGPADLIVLSEVLYYLDEADLVATFETVATACHDRTDVVAVHWRPRPERAHTTGGAAQRALNDALIGRGFERVITHTDVEFVLALWSQDIPETVGR